MNEEVRRASETSSRKGLSYSGSLGSLLCFIKPENESSGRLTMSVRGAEKA